VATEYTYVVQLMAIAIDASARRPRLRLLRRVFPTSRQLPLMKRSSRRQKASDHTMR
jgi:hypothetical protein